MKKRSDKPEKPPQGRLYRLACYIKLLDVGRAATEEQGKVKRYAVSSRASPSAHCILISPNPKEMNDSGLTSNHLKC